MARIRDRVDELSRREESSQNQSQAAPQRDREAAPQLSEPSRENTGSYFTTGPNPLVVDVGEFRQMRFGLLARTVNLRFTDDIDVAFRPPFENDSAVISLTAAESPFTIGGEVGIDTGFMWVRQADTAAGAPQLQVIAYE